MVVAKSDSTATYALRNRRSDRLEKRLSWRDLVKRRSRAGAEHNEAGDHVVMAWRTSAPGAKCL
jgi:hypothetical protein